jgi:periplasmic protein TonB
MPIASAAPAPMFVPDALPGQSAEPYMNPRLMPVVIAVVCAHGLALWALQAGFQRPETQIDAPAMVVIATLLDAPQPEAAPASPPEPSPPAQPVAQAAPKRAAQPLPRQTSPQPQPHPVSTPPIESAQPDAPETAISAPAASESMASAAIAPAPTAPATAAAAAPSPSAPPKVELPSSNASYLNNPKAPYPGLSKRLGEQGNVVIRVLIGTDGTASQASVHASSGYERLDQTARETVLKWRFVPGKRGGVPEAMWFNVPLSFVLE